MPRSGETEERISSKEMQTLEVNAEYFGISQLQLMENAGRSIAHEISLHVSTGKKVILFCGLGGNGGDGFVAARHLSSMGYKTKVVLAGQGKAIKHEAALRNWKALQFLKESIVVVEVKDSSSVPKTDADVIVDALLGIGTKGKLRSPIRQIVECINNSQALKIAVDVPTGLDSDTGKVSSVAVKADITITFYKAKTGFRRAGHYLGKLLVKNIGLPELLERYVGPGDVHKVRKKRSSQAHKGDFGRLLVVGGSEVFSGAPALVSLAALRTGVDITYLAAPSKTAKAISSISPDLITIKLQGKHFRPSNIQELTEYLNVVDAVVLGPGLGLKRKTGEFVKEFIAAVEEASKPLLIDADGLKHYAEFKRPLKTPFVLTPHAGEYKNLFGKTLPEEIPDRIREVRRAAAEVEGILLVKGAVDVCSDGKRVKLNFTGNPGMTVGGTGDVLSGIIGAFLAQGTQPFQAAAAGAFVNGAAGDFVAKKLGYHIIATDLLDRIPHVIDDPMSHLEVRGKIAGST